jgi:hypothetical protein
VVTSPIPVYTPLDTARQAVLGARFDRARCGNLTDGPMRELPPDLAALDDADLVVQRTTRDDRLADLFRKWPKLAGRELQELRRLYDERLRLARHLGRIRRGRAK